MVANLLDGAKFEVVHIDTTGTAVSTETTSLALVDMQGYDSLCYLGIINTLTAAGDIGLEDYEADSSAGTYYALDTDYMSYKVTTTTGDNKAIAILDIQKPLRRWHSIRVYRATQPSRMDVVAIKYNAREYPVDNSTSNNYSVVASQTVVSPTSSM